MAQHVLAEEAWVSAPRTMASDERLRTAKRFRQLVAERLEPSYRLATLIMGDARDAEDATHDALVSAFRGLAALRDPTRIDAWLTRIVVNACRQRLRQARRRPTVALDPARHIGTHQPLDVVVERMAIDGAMASLSEEHRLVVILRYYRDLTIDDIADVLGVPSGTVKSRLHHALRSLHATMEPREPDR